MKYRCTFHIPKIEEIIEADNIEEAEYEFYKIHDFSELDFWFSIKQFRKKRQSKESKR